MRTKLIHQALIDAQIDHTYSNFKDGKNEWWCKLHIPSMKIKCLTKGTIPEGIASKILVLLTKQLKEKQP